jgi:hypothetical protein
MKNKMETYLSKVGAERPEEAYNWETTGKKGDVRTKFFRRYSADFE